MLLSCAGFSASSIGSRLRGALDEVETPLDSPARECRDLHTVPRLAQGVRGAQTQELYRDPRDALGLLLPPLRRRV